MSNTELTVAPQQNIQHSGNSEAFALAQRQAMALSQSDLVPENYRGKIANCLIALEISQRTGASALMVMQNLYLVHGRPSWSSQYIISAINSCGRFIPLRFRVEGDGDNKTCTAWTKDKSGEVLEGPPVSISMAKAEGWYAKNGSKWKTMPDLMLRYRSAAFFGRLYAPDILMGMKTAEEQLDMVEINPRVPDENADPFQKAAAGVEEVIDHVTGEVIEPDATSQSSADAFPGDTK